MNTAPTQTTDRSISRCVDDVAGELEFIHRMAKDALPYPFTPLDHSRKAATLATMDQLYQEAADYLRQFEKLAHQYAELLEEAERKQQAGGAA